MVKLYPGVAQLVARMVRVHEAVGSTPATRTKIEYSCHSQSWILYFHIHIGTKRGVFMQAIDNEFFEAYKRLDRLCSDIYGCRNGVSQYIEDMERVSYQGRLAIPSWEQAYRTLKHLRWVRNQLAHDSGQLQLCEERDIQDTNSFYDDIMSGRDPLTQLRRYQEDHLAVKKSAQRAKPAAMPTVSDHSNAARQPRRTGCFPVAILLLACAAVIVFYFLAHLL